MGVFTAGRIRDCLTPWKSGKLCGPKVENKTGVDDDDDDDDDDVVVVVVVVFKGDIDISLTPKKETDIIYCATLWQILV